jgi:hypothetical protein
MPKKNKIKKRLQNKKALTTIEKMTPHGQSLGQDNIMMLRPNMPQHQKLSNALLEMMRPESQHLTKFYEYEYLLEMIVIAWNFSITHDPKDAMEALTPEKYTEQNLKTIEYFARKKVLLFPNDKRIIIKWGIEDKENKIFVTAATHYDMDGNPYILNPK